MNPHKFSVFWYKKKRSQLKKKIKKIFVEKNITNFTAIFLHDNG